MFAQMSHALVHLTAPLCMYVYFVLSLRWTGGVQANKVLTLPKLGFCARMLHLDVCWRAGTFLKTSIRLREATDKIIMHFTVTCTNRFV